MAVNTINCQDINAALFHLEF